MKEEIDFLWTLAWDDLTIFGSAIFSLFLIVLFSTLGFIDFSIKLLMSFILAYLVTILIRSFYFKERPKKQEFSNYIEKIDASSFPSMHSIRGSIYTTLFFLNFNNTYLISLFFILMIIISFSRYINKKHHLSDILAGLLIGMLIGFFSNFLI